MHVKDVVSSSVAALITNVAEVPKDDSLYAVVVWVKRDPVAKAPLVLVHTTPTLLNSSPKMSQDCVTAVPTKANCGPVTVGTAPRTYCLRLVESKDPKSPPKSTPHLYSPLLEKSALAKVKTDTPDVVVMPELV